MKTIEKEVLDVSDSLEKAGVSFNGQRILVTGGAGFLGSWVCEVLVRQGAAVTCIDNLTSGQQENIEHLIRGDGFTYMNHDITDPIYFDSKFDTVFHMASRASPFEFAEHPIQILKANTLGIWVALGIAKEHGARFFYTSTSEVYGNPDPRFVPTPESYFGNVNSVGPRGCYDEAKRAGEAFVTAYHTQHGLDTRMVRIFNTYGPRMRSDDIYGRVVPRFIDQALKNEPITIFGDGSQTRSFTYIMDQVEGILRLAGAEGLQNPVVNIGNNVEKSVLQLAETIISLTDSKSKLSFHPLPIDDPLRRSPDISRAKELLGWEPKIGFEEGLKRFIEYMR
ncbi:UDP-glucose 4-epimerase [archaeon BMS3Abin16]|nr:UDP-glucose 4-epimerase [archaeon BMS3Abin16]